MTGQQLGDRMDDDIGTMIERLETAWRGKSVVDDEQQPFFAAELCDALDVGDTQRGV